MPFRIPTSYGPGIIWFLIVLFLLTLPGSEIPNPIPWMQKIYFDKWVHAGLFAVLTWLWLNPTLRTGKTLSTQRMVTTVFVIIAWGLATEYIQDQWVPFRSFEWSDWGADAAGTLMGAIFFHQITLPKHKKRNSSFK
ncbi:MAG TPA: VanZ family protein [Ferruginibacter sp.]|nr:VanZ family protein [Ferruginibacter sp.]HRO17743.1 VanZ family protein [Ferruginibacter sp.]HRQ21491.1 VanZ family protein [Ferruginibacter sp.]